MTTVSVDSTASPDVVWNLLSRPARWHEWSPHVRGAWGLGSPQVREGARGAVRLLGAVPVPARILRVTPRGWSWRVGPITMDHRVRKLAGGGSRIAMDLHAPLLLRPVVLAYAPICRALLHRLATVAESR